MPNTHPLAWTDEEDTLLYSLYFPHKGNFERIRQLMENHGYYRTVRALQVRFSEIKARRKKPLRMPCEEEMIALHKPWTR